MIIACFMVGGLLLWLNLKINGGWFKVDAAKGVGALIAFKAWLRSTFVCDMFTTPDDLGRKITVALAKSLIYSIRWRAATWSRKDARLIP